MESKIVENRSSVSTLTYDPVRYVIVLTMVHTTIRILETMNTNMHVCK